MCACLTFGELMVSVCVKCVFDLIFWRLIFLVRDLAATVFLMFLILPEILLVKTKKAGNIVKKIVKITLSKNPRSTNEIFKIQLFFSQQSLVTGG